VSIMTSTRKLADTYKGTALIMIVVVALFEVATDVTGWLEPVLFPGLVKIIPAFRESLPRLLDGLVNSFGLGLFIGYRPTLKKMLMPIFRGISPIPPTMLIPYAISVLPTFWLSSAFIIFAGAFWPILLGTIHGVVLLEERYLDNARTLGLKGGRLLWKVVFPGALPHIFAGAGMALVFSFILLTVAEMFGAKSGMGYFIQYYADFCDYPKVLAGMIFMSVSIVLVMMVFDTIQRRTLHWTGKR
jgi:NitT/TauT family transport system permease protein